jgi:hypothetical protein
MDQDEFVTSEESLAGEDNVASADGSAADSNAANLSLEELNQVLGKNFPSKEAALKSVKDTFNYVGSVGQLQKELKDLKSSTPGADVTEKVTSLEQRLKETEFYSEHPDLKEHKDLIRKFGSDPAQAVADPEFQKVLTAVKTAAESEKSKSVIHSNSRLGQVTDRTAEARAAMDAGDTDKAQKLAAQNVLEAAGILPS